MVSRRWEIDSKYSTDAYTQLGKNKFVHGGNESDCNTGDRTMMERGCNIKQWISRELMESRLICSVFAWIRSVVNKFVFLVPQGYLMDSSLIVEVEPGA
jgi:hypothetical protein